MRIQVLMENTARDPELAAEHGLSLLVETRRHRILFDAGQSGAFAENARRMGVDLRDVDVAVLSHGHYDRAPVYLSRQAFLPLYNGRGEYIGLDESLEGSGRLVPVDGELRIDEELSLHACERRERIVPVENFGLRLRLGGALVPDDFRHEQYLLVRDGERRVLFSGCSHRGIVNIVNWFEPDVLVGGFHFMKLDPDDPGGRAKLEAAARELLRHPAMYYTGHCTGTGQYAHLKQIMGDRLEYLFTGRTVTL